MRMRGFFAAIAALAIANMVQMPAVAADPDIVTVFGKVGHANRDPFDPFRDAFLNYREKTFEKAYSFSRESLLKLPQVTVQARAEGWPGPIKATGPRLEDVLVAAGVATNATITATALDGYAVELDAAKRRQRAWVLAIDADGRPLSIGGRGPAWLIYDTAGATVAPDVEADWVWSLFIIEAL